MKLPERFCLTTIYNLLIPCFGVSSYQIMPLSLLNTLFALMGDSSLPLKQQNITHC